mgnify:CR=1 FL=1
MKIVILLALCLSIIGCGKIGKTVAGLTGSYESCIDGVSYLQFTSGVTVKYLPDGSIATCK